LVVVEHGNAEEPFQCLVVVALSYILLHVLLKVFNDSGLVYGSVAEGVNTGGLVKLVLHPNDDVYFCKAESVEVLFQPRHAYLLPGMQPFLFPGGTFKFQLDEKHVFVFGNSVQDLRDGFEELRGGHAPPNCYE